MTLIALHPFPSAAVALAPQSAWTSLQYAASFGEAESVKLLLQAGANFKTKDAVRDMGKVGVVGVREWSERQ